MKDWISLEQRLDWELTKQCNLQCSHCISRIYHPRIRGELSEDEARCIVDRCCEAGINLIHFFGGEPTVRRDFFNLLSRCDGLGIATSFTTNGTTVDKELVTSLASLRHLRRVCFSFEDIREAAHDSIRGKGCFEAACRGLRDFTSNVLDIPVSISFTLNRPAMMELHPRDIVNFFAERGADRIVFQDLAVPDDAPLPFKGLSYESGCWLSFIYKLFDPDFNSAIPFVYEIKPIVAEHLNRVLGSKLPIVYCGCNAISTEYRLLPNGVVVPCSAIIGWPEELDVYLSDAPRLVDRPLHEILGSELYQQFLAAKREKGGDPFMEPCRSCHLSYRRCNPCIFGRIRKDIHKIQSCSWIKEVENGIS